jgi:alanyl-tRNA synthetase
MTAAERVGVEELRISDEKGAASLRIIADHARAATFLISDGVLPANEGAGMCCGRFCGAGFGMGGCWGRRSRFMHEMVFAVRDEMQVLIRS